MPSSPTTFYSRITQQAQKQPHNYFMICAFMVMLLWISLMQFNAYRQAPYLQTYRFNNVQELSSAGITPQLYTRQYYKSIIRYATGQHTLFSIDTNGCIKGLWVNGNAIDIPMKPDGYYIPRRCTGPNRINIDLAPYLYNAANVLYVETVSLETKHHLYIWPNYRSMQAWCYTMIWLYILGAGLFWFTRHFRLDMTTATMCLLSIFIYLIQWISTDLIDRSNDIGGHIYYIHHIAERLSLPVPDSPQTQQPPLYYMLSAIVLLLNGWIDVAYSGRTLMGESVLLFLAYSAFGILTLRRAFPKGSLLYYVALGMFLFWPHNFVIATKVNNDVLLYCLGSAILYVLTVWHQDKKHQLLPLAIILCGLAVMTKSTGLLFCAITGLMALYHLLIRRTLTWRTVFSKPFLWAYGMFLLCAGANFGRILYFKYVLGMKVALISNPILVGTVYGVPNGWQYFTQMEMTRFFIQPFMSAFSPSREYFWNYLFKTLLFGEWTDWQQPELALLLAGLLLFMTALIIGWLIYVFTIKRDTALSDQLVLPAIAMIIMIAGLMYFRYSLPAAPSNNARYIYNIILPIAWLFAGLCQQLQQKNAGIIRNIPFVICLIAACTFTAGSFIFEAANTQFSFIKMFSVFRFGGSVV